MSIANLTFKLDEESNAIASLANLSDFYKEEFFYDNLRPELERFFQKHFLSHFTKRGQGQKLTNIYAILKNQMQRQQLEAGKITNLANDKSQIAVHKGWFTGSTIGEILSDTEFEKDSSGHINAMVVGITSKMWPSSPASHTYVIKMSDIAADIESLYKKAYQPKKPTNAVERPQKTTKQKPLTPGADIRKRMMSARGEALKTIRSAAMLEKKLTNPPGNVIVTVNSKGVHIKWPEWALDALGLEDIMKKAEPFAGKRYFAEGNRATKTTDDMFPQDFDDAFADKALDAAEHLLTSLWYGSSNVRRYLGAKAKEMFGSESAGFSLSEASAIQRQLYNATLNTMNASLYQDATLDEQIRGMIDNVFKTQWTGDELGEIKHSPYRAFNITGEFKRQHGSTYRALSAVYPDIVGAGMQQDIEMLQLSNAPRIASQTRDMQKAMQSSEMIKLSLESFLDALQDSPGMPAPALLETVFNIVDAKTADKIKKLLAFKTRSKGVEYFHEHDAAEMDLAEGMMTILNDFLAGAGEA